ncbi:SH3 domain-containing protein [Tropicibacter sp. S64]|uniref:SH3 domain-containing protein n=1 Tax=Tropicibacter sp. S64 TaxID=3415122 RepID=UPI003C7CD276
MHRVIFLTFGFLGWAWYELSGGSAFVPGEHSLALLAPPITYDAPAEPRRVAMLSTKSETPLPESQIIRREPVEAAKPEVPEVTRTSGMGTAGLTDLSGLTEIAVTEPDAEADPVQLIVTALQADAPPATRTAEASSIDYRTVSGSVVNLRSGPGTGYDVVAQLFEGEEVEVMQDAGGGWVQLRAMAGNNEIGWMSDRFLIAY